MQSATSIEARTTEITKITQTEQDIASLHQHLKNVIEGAAFKGSHRSGQFLRYIVEQAIAGHFESLKERVIGVELFGRPPSYDTGEDAIVRVTASDVRKRLLQHYGQYGATSELRISLPSGSYIPQVTREPHGSGDMPGVDYALVQQVSSVAETAPKRPVVVPPAEAVPEPPIAIRRIPWVVFRILIIISIISILAIVGILLTVIHVVTGAPVFSTHSPQREAGSAVVLPWSAFFSSPNPTQLIMSDPNIVTIQEFTDTQLSLSDYANRSYIPEPNTLTPEANRLSRIILRGDNPAEVDVPIAVNIAQIAHASSRRINVHAARNIQLSDLKTDDNFVFLGSPRSDPWSSLFSDQLDFSFVFDKDTRQEIIRNVHPRLSEPRSYVPTALGWATGQSFAIIALVRNPDQNGHVLLLAGANGEGTEAAGRLVTDLARFSGVLEKCGIAPSGPLQEFEVLLRLNTMAGSPNNVDVVACHVLSRASGR
jgi:hypothetical protein